MEELEKYLIDNKLHVVFSEDIADLLNKIHDIIGELSICIIRECKITPPPFEVVVVEGKDIQAGYNYIKGKAYIFVNSGIIKEQREYLEKLHWDKVKLNSEIADFIDALVENGFYFVVMHEYVHIMAKHSDLYLTKAENDLKQTKEIEADHFAMDFLITKAIADAKDNTDKIIENLKAAYLAAYFLLENKRKYINTYCNSEYNDRVMINIYDDEQIKKRDHPLDIQRMILLFRQFRDIYLCDNGLQKLSVQESITTMLKELKDLDYDLTNESLEQKFVFVNESVNKLETLLPELWRKKSTDN